MTARNWSTLADNATVAFGDTINFNNVAYHAAKVVLVDITGAMSVTLGAKSVTMTGLTIAQVTPATFSFLDGSAIVVGTNAGNTLGVVAGVHADLIYGLGGNDVIDGGQGADTMIGGQGNDSYKVDSAGDKVVEDSIAGSGVDTVTTSVENDSLDANVENMVLDVAVVKASGNSGNNTITGNALANNLLGLPGNDNLIGKGSSDTLDGGAGNDTLDGGGGNDTYIIDSADDSIVADPTGVDKVKIAAGTGFDYTLVDGLEKLDARLVTLGHTLTGSSGDDTIFGSAKDDSMVGAEGDDSLLGGAGIDTLVGGAGADTLVGGAGKDVYVIDDSDTVHDTAGSDTVKIIGTGFDYTLADDAENLDVSMALGSHSYAGNDKNNIITGSAYGETLNGGLGADRLTGGAGDDTYVLDNLGDKVQGETGGNDTVKLTGGAFSTYTLTGVLENLDASASTNTGGASLTGGNAANSITGSGYADALTGGMGNDTLEGGAGQDSLHGDAGDDVIAYDAADGVADGGTGVDTLVVDDASLDLGAKAGDQIQNVDIIDLANAAGALTLSSADLLALAPDGDTLRVTGSAGDSVVAAGAWTSDGQTTVSGVTYDAFTEGSATLLVQAGIDQSGINLAPAGADDTHTLAEDGSYTFGAGDFGFSDANAGDTLQAVRIDSLPTSGTLQLDNVAVGAGDVIAVGDLGDLVFSPAADENGQGYAALSFSVQDNHGGYSVASSTLTFDVTAVNDAPVAGDDTLSSVGEDSSTRVISFASLIDNDSAGPADESGQALTITAVDNAVGGTVTINGGNVEFTPGADFNGAASFDYTLQDDGQTNGSDDFKTGTGHASFTVTEANDAPVAVDDTLSSVEEDSGARVISFASLTGNDIAGPANESGQALTIAAVSNAVGGTAVINGTNVYFTPGADFSGAVSFEYTLRDDGKTNGIDDFKTDTGHVFFVVTEVNDAPVAVDDTLSGVSDSGTRVISFASLAGNDGAGPADESGQALTITAVGNAVGGAAVINGTNVEFTPDASFDGTASFDYTVQDNGTTDGASDFKSDTGTVSFTVSTSNIDLSALNGTNGFKISGELAGDQSGYSVSDAGDVNGDGLDDFIVSAPGVDLNGSNAGASYVVFGNASGFGANLDLSALSGSDGFQISGEAAGDFAGRSVSQAGDVNGDGFDDVIIGAHNADPNGSSNAGAGYVVFGAGSGFGANLDLSALNGTNGFRIAGELTLDYAGRSVSAAGDVNGDGFGDLIVGAPGADPNASAAGAGYVLFGKASGFSASLDLSALNGANGFQMSGVALNDKAGFSVSTAGDVNGDSFADVIVGAYGVATSTGAAYVVFGTASAFGATIELSALNGTDGFKITGVVTTSSTARSVSSAGDVNGDGFDDVIVGAPQAGPGASYVVFGHASGFGANLNLSALDGTNGFKITGAQFLGAEGRSVSAAGDVNGDGIGDLIVGANNVTVHNSYSGASYVVFGTTSGFGASIELSALNGTNGFQISGDAALDGAGISVSAAGDLNGDGFDDVIVGASNADPHGTSSGASYVLYGRNFTGAVAQAGTSADDSITGTGAGETLIGGMGSDTIAGAGGADLLKGAAGNDVLAGGSGSDRLEGDAGNDAFLFDQAPGVSNVDTIMDFAGAGSAALDTIELSSGIFTSLGAGALSAGSFVSGASPVAADASDFILYNTATGELYYDADGNGAGAAVKFAVVAGHPAALAASDFTVV